jgi:hypothetical protein
MLEHMVSHVKAVRKYLLSFTKSDWQLSDYPLRFRRQKHDPGECYGRLKLPAWSVQVINWWQLGGSGDTKEEAYLGLKATFEKLKAEGAVLPRPGTGLPIVLAPSDEVANHTIIAADFFEKILGIDYRNCFISNESSLWDFHMEESNDHLNRKIQDVYGVDISDVDNAKLVKIFERLISAEPPPNRSLRVSAGLPGSQPTSSGVGCVSPPTPPEL